MIRDKIQTKEYFQKSIEWYSQCLQEDLEDFKKINQKILWLILGLWLLTMKIY